MDEDFKVHCLKNRLPITLLHMQCCAKIDEHRHYLLTINHGNGLKVVNYDFYKHISTY